MAAGQTVRADLAAIRASRPAAWRISRRLTDSFFRHVLAQLVKPDIGFRVAGSAPIAAWRKRTTGADLRPVGEGGALKLAGFEETLEEDFEPLLDGRQVILDP